MRDRGVLGEVEAVAAPAEEGEEAEAPPPPPVPDLPVVATCKAIGRVLELNRTLTALMLRGCSLDQPEPEEAPPVEEAPARAPAPAVDEETDTGGKGEAPAEEGEEEDAPPALPPPPPPPLLGEVIGSAMAKALKSGLTLLDARDNALGDMGVGALAAGLVGAKALRALYLSGCCTPEAEAAVSKGVAAQGAIVLSDLGYAAEGGASEDEDDALQVVLATNRYEHALLWDELLAHFPPAAAAAAAAAFAELPGATATSAPLYQVLSRLVSPETLATLDASAPAATLPFGGFVQWVADCFAGSWDIASGASSRFAHLMRTLAYPQALPDPEAAAEADGPEWLAHAAKLLCVQTRRYFARPKPKPREPEDADDLCGSAQATLWNILGKIDEAAEHRQIGFRQEKRA